jgi:hypothetical protein
MLMDFSDFAMNSKRAASIMSDRAAGTPSLRAAGQRER